MLSAIIAALAPKKKNRKSRLLNEANARRFGMVKGMENLTRRGCWIVAQNRRMPGWLAATKTMKILMRVLVLLIACVVGTSAMADEGMWTFDHFPVAAVKQAYGVDITPAWLDHVRLSSVRLANCSASFVSAEGLILTNHHCITQCLAELSTKDSNLLELGFTAATRREELNCLNQRADVLMDTENITSAVLKAGAALNDADANVARNRLLTALEQNCEQASAKLRTGKLVCQSVKLYQGGEYYLYKYRRYTDVRLVMAPEADIASFGGDPDNFQYPRWSLDFAILRAYENDKPAKTPNFLRINSAGPAAGQLVFVAGDPGSTARLQTRAQLNFDRDISLPVNLMRASELRGRYIQFGKNNPADNRIIRAALNSLQNGLKIRRKELDALNDDEKLSEKSLEEQRLRDAAQLPGSDPWRDIEAALKRERMLYLPNLFIENGAGFGSVLFRDARQLVRGADERLKPNQDRLREFTDSALPGIERDLFARVPTYAQFEQLTLSFSLERMREWLGPDHPIVRQLLSKESPDALATRLIAETQLDDAALRRRLWQTGKAAVDASHDPMIELARAIDADARAIRKRYDDEVDAPIANASQRIAAARFKVYGNHTYPDATFTLRLNFGTVQGWLEDGVPKEPFTHLDRAFERATGDAPFRIPDSWIKAKSALDLHTPFCISTSNDIVGGNSGSPLIDAGGNIVGLMFDGNIHSVAGRYWFDSTNNRAIAVHPAIIREALSKVYGAKSLLAELNLM
jgi:hypothetical protein